MSTEFDVNFAINQLATTKERLTDLEAEYKANKKALEEHLKGVVDQLNTYMSNNELQNIKNETGTAYYVTNSYVNVSNKEEFLEYVKSNDRFDLLKVEPLKNQVIKNIQNTGEVPPGIRFEQYKEINFKRN